MGVLWWVAPVLVAVFGVWFFGSGAAHMFRGQPARGSRRVVGGTAVAAIGLALSLVGVNIQMFSRLTHEGPVAEVSVKATDASQNLYLVTVKRLDGDIPVQKCTLQGDEWLVGGQVQKWQPWANILGLDATYTLDQITNKYSSAARGNGKTITSCDLKGTPVVNSYVPPTWLPWILEHFYTEDRKFGSMNYMPLVDGAVYRIVITQSGFNAEPLNTIAKDANGGRGP